VRAPHFTITGLFLILHAQIFAWHHCTPHAKTPHIHGTRPASQSYHSPHIPPTFPAFSPRRDLILPLGGIKRSEMAPKNSSRLFVVCTTARIRRRTIFSVSHLARAISLLRKGPRKGYNGAVAIKSPWSGSVSLRPSRKEGEAVERLRQWDFQARF
jgi:hypothetical protein